MNKIQATSLSLLFAMLCAACSAFQSEGQQEEAMDFEGFGDQVRECDGAWKDLFDEWYREVGSLGPSLLSIQEFVQDAGDSEFRQVILNIWDENELLRQDDAIWGSWPVSPEVFRQQTYLISKGFKHLVPDECSSASWLYPIVGTTLYIGEDGNKYGYMVPNDAPSEFEWSSPALQHWYVFWLFIRHPNLDNDLE